MRRRITLSAKMILFGTGGIIAFSLALGWVYLKMENRVYQGEESKLKIVTDVAITLLNEYDARIKAGELTVEEGHIRAAQRIKNLRYSGEEYFWINDMTPRMIMHPFKPELDGKDLSESTDPHGKHLFVEMVKVCKASGAGFVEYMWPKQGKTKPVPKLSYVKYFEPWGWIIGTGVYMDYVEKELAQIRYVFLGVLAVLGIGGILFSLWLTRSTAQPIVRAVEGITATTGELTSVSGKMSSASRNLGEGASQQAAAIEETSSSLEEIASMTRQNAENAGQADRLMNQANAIVERSNKAMADLTGSMQEIYAAGESTQRIVKTIDEIAFQTNLLALNAAVEAARAGEAGAGFAVVADEVRNLAMRAAEAAKNTADLIENTVRRVHDGSDLVEKTAGEFSEVTAIVLRASELVSEIAAASNEQREGIDQVNKAVSEMDKVVQQNASSAEETASVSEGMSAQVEQVRALLVDLAALIGVDNTTKAPEAGGVHRPEIASVAARQIAHRQQRGSNGKNAVARLRAKEIRPEQVVPLEQKHFDNF